MLRYKRKKQGANLYHFYIPKALFFNQDISLLTGNNTISLNMSGAFRL